ncbi:alkyl hydroperoxide reductase subunit AhpC [Cytobacillus purgationiresistens]|uniref:Alkyl hydroperoxide reductase subunit AhpC n=2 Tax=Cytobacillus purgationiresistens TaxID=863449 RepID=A0ABU0ACW8_9BACI|nr:alkyl hydroperoxide reductase subunit AhpC [Cytobacillus purgationiresistens]
MNMYIVSNDEPQYQKLLYDELTKQFGGSLPFISDPDSTLIDEVGMKNGDTTYRGYVILDPNGEVVLKKVNDHWGEELPETLADIKEAYEGL